MQALTGFRGESDAAVRRGMKCTGRPTAPILARYRCFLPDLAGLAGLRRVGPGTEESLPSQGELSYPSVAAATCGAAPTGHSPRSARRIPPSPRGSSPRACVLRKAPQSTVRHPRRQPDRLSAAPVPASWRVGSRHAACASLRCNGHALRCADRSVSCPASKDRDRGPPACSL